MRPAQVGSDAAALAETFRAARVPQATNEHVQILFACDVDAVGKAYNIRTFHVPPETQGFADAVRGALGGVRFEPAFVEGQPATVMVTGSAHFRPGAAPPVTVVLNWTETNKPRADSVAPQLIGGQDELLGQTIYPPAARKHKQDGSASVSFVVRANGSLTQFKIEDETPRDYGFGPAAMEGLRWARFIPAQRRGQAVDTRVTQTVYFSLQRLALYGTRRSGQAAK
jgi:TonB family protein